MSRGDAWSVSATLIAAAIGFRVGGPAAAWICLIAGLIMAIILHFSGKKKGKLQPSNRPIGLLIEGNAHDNLFIDSEIDGDPAVKMEGTPHGNIFIKTRLNQPNKKEEDEEGKNK